MTRSDTEVSRVHPAVMGYYIALAAVLQLLEGLFPAIIPGVKLGAANAVTLFVLSVFGVRAALMVALLRPVVAAMASGTLTSPLFLISVTASCAATLCMAATSAIFRRAMSHIGVSVVGAVVHNLTQLAVVRALFLRSPILWVFVPVLIVSGVVFGWLTGTLVNVAVAALPVRPVLRERFGMGKPIERQTRVGVDGMSYVLVWVGVSIACMVWLALAWDVRSLALCAAGVLVVRVISGVRFGRRFSGTPSRFKVRLLGGMILSLGIMHLATLWLREGWFGDPRPVLEPWAVSSIKVLLFVLVSDALTASRTLYHWLERIPVVAAALLSVEGLMHRVPAAAREGVHGMLTRMLVREVFEDGDRGDGATHASPPQLPVSLGLGGEGAHGTLQ